MCVNRYSWPVRLCSFLMALALAVFVVGQPRAKAVAVVDDVAVGAMSCEAFLASIGLPLTATGGSSAVTAGVTAAAGEYAAATGAAASGEAFLGTVAAGTALSTAGAIVLTAGAAIALGAFAYWLYETYLKDVDSGTSVPIYSDIYLYTADGDRIALWEFEGINHGINNWGLLRQGKHIPTSSASSVELANGTVISFSSDSIGNRKITFTSASGTTASDSISGSFDGSYWGIGFDTKGSNYWYLHRYIDYSNPESRPSGYIPMTYTYQYSYRSTFFNGATDSEEVAFKDFDYEPVPEFPDTQQMVIDVGAAPGTTLDDLAQSVPDAIANGNFQPTYNIQVSPAPDPVPVPEPAPEVNPNPEVEAPEDIAPFTVGLGEVFPFCIPFDIYHMVTMFAAEPEAPAATWEFTLPWSGQECEVSWSLEEWDEVAKLCRSLELVLFCVGLAAATYKMIKW